MRPKETILPRKAPQPVFQLMVTLQHRQPTIWRRIHVPADIRLGELHEVLQVVMGWEDAHLHAFRNGGTECGEPDPQFPGGMRTERNDPLGQVASVGDTFWYEYDFGDGWLHAIRVEQTLPGDTPHPRCVGGERAAPPEDCGGPPGYASAAGDHRRSAASGPQGDAGMDRRGVRPRGLRHRGGESEVGGSRVRMHHSGQTDR